MKASNILLIMTICLISCKNVTIPKDIHYINQFVEEPSELTKQELVLLLYEEKFNKKIKIKTNLGSVLYKTSSVKGNSRLLNIKFPEEASSIIISYNKKKYSVMIEKPYKYILINFKRNSILDIAYSNKMPEYTD
ncbi:MULTISPECIES: hypothetical protein [unclassified Chryseobacterium]|jgi:hypothetical protein|uniref:hypothetical protein n=1 Tax=unclassified Chryseobacterium TaxID=2593645 RepID=UPI001C5A5FC7|nr:MULTISPECIES: hypothetical protein [unclassified Chryseobacterium]MBW3523456.1 hypothetical protein [Chryseobacterium sp. NKUCC03_KSP]MCD0457752.1 hypothetical protein [Chryseobacterium sp. LC2016-27]